jgi:hypothetical protein
MRTASVDRGAVTEHTVKIYLVAHVRLVDIQNALVKKNRYKLPLAQVASQAVLDTDPSKLQQSTIDRLKLKRDRSISGRRTLPIKLTRDARTRLEVIQTEKVLQWSATTDQYPLSLFLSSIVMRCSVHKVFGVRLTETVPQEQPAPDTTPPA